MKKQSKNNRSMFLPLDRQPKYQWPANITECFEKGINNLLVSKSEMYGFDIESKGLDPFLKDVFVISVAISNDVNSVIAQVIQHNDLRIDEWSFDRLKEMVEDFKIILIGHNIKFDLKWLAVKYGWKINCQVFDSMMASYLLNENDSAGLDNCMEKYLGQPSYKGMVNTSDLESEHIDDVLLYNAKDAETESRLCRVQIPLLEKEGLLPLMVVANQVFPILTKMEVRGVNLDRAYTKATEKQLLEDCVKDRVAINKAGYGAIKPDSDTDLRKLLYNLLGFTPTKFTESGKASTDAEAIADLRDGCVDYKVSNLLDSILSYTKKMKLLTTNYQPIGRWLDYDNRVHTSYSLGKQYDGGAGGTVTGRLSSTSPNLQNIPRGKEHRGMFIPSEGYSFIDGDFSQLELRVVAYLSQEPVMIQAFENDYDIHTAVMADMLSMDYEELKMILNEGKDASMKEMRVAIKRINFGIVYGVGAARLQSLIKNELKLLKTKEWCQDLIDTWLKKYSRVAAWLEQQKQFAIHTGYVTQPFGQKRRLPDAKLAQGGFYKLDSTGRMLASRALRQATNFPVQSTAAWICLIGMILIDQYFKDHLELDGHLLMQVHDSVLCEIKNWYYPQTVVPSADGHHTVYDSPFLNDGHNAQVARDIQHIMEVKTIEFMKDFFNINFNCPLSFPVKVLNRWE